MSFSYDSTLASDLDVVRFRLGDTVTPGHLVEDEEITATLTANTGLSLWRTVADIARSLAGRYATASEQTAGEGLSVSYKRFERFMELARIADQKAEDEEQGIPGSLVAGSKPLAGGIIVSEIAQAEADSERPDRDLDQPFGP